MPGTRECHPYQGKLSYDPVKSFAPISLAGIAPLILTVNNNFPAKDVKELIAYAKANPGKVNFGSSGIGAAAHLTTELLKQTAGIDMVHVPFKGTAPALRRSCRRHPDAGRCAEHAHAACARRQDQSARNVFRQAIQGAAEVADHGRGGRPAARVLDLGVVPRAGRQPRDIVNLLSTDTAKAINESDIKERFNQIGLSSRSAGTPELGRREFLSDEIANGEGHQTPPA